MQYNKLIYEDTYIYNTYIQTNFIRNFYKDIKLISKKKKKKIQHLFKNKSF